MNEKSRDLYDSFQKIDAHFHLNTDRPALLEEAGEEGFEAMVAIHTEADSMFTKVDNQIAHTLSQKNVTGSGDRLYFVTTFTTERWGESDWADRAIQQIRTGLDRGAVGVKIWKNIGMELTRPDGRYVMVDDPSFDPIFEWLEEREVPLLAHLGEPKNCWLPLEEMTVTSDRDYFSTHHRFHMYGKSHMPDYEEQLAARDRRLNRHPRLRFIGLHLASLEWSVDEVARWLDRYPRCGVDLAERVCHLQHQAVSDPERVKSFVETYQDRIIYGTDQIDDGSADNSEVRDQIRNKWHSEFQFFAEKSRQAAWNVEKPFQGLGLSKKVLEKIFRKNAITYYPRLGDSLN